MKKPLLKYLFVGLSVLVILGLFLFVIRSCDIAGSMLVLIVFLTVFSLAIAFFIESFAKREPRYKILVRFIVVLGIITFLLGIFEIGLSTEPCVPPPPCSINNQPC